MSDNDNNLTIAEGRYLRLSRRGSWEYAERVGASGVVAVVAVTVADELILTEQYRRPVQRRVIDLPAGLAGDDGETADETPENAARRELEEETGFRARILRRVATLPTSPGLTSETVMLFVAEGVTRIGAGGGDESESILVHLAPRTTIAAWLDERIDQGCLVDPKVYAALWWLQRGF